MGRTTVGFCWDKYENGDGRACCKLSSSALSPWSQGGSNLPPGRRGLEPKLLKMETSISKLPYEFMAYLKPLIPCMVFELCNNNTAKLVAHGIRLHHRDSSVSQVYGFEVVDVLLMFSAEFVWVAL